MYWEELLRFSKGKKMDRNRDKYEDEADWVKRAEFKLDRYNHLMEFLRTFLGACTLTLQVVILLKLFKVI